MGLVPICALLYRKEKMQKYKMSFEIEAIRITKKNCKELKELYSFDFEEGIIEESIGCWILNRPSGLDIAPGDLKLRKI